MLFYLLSFVLSDDKYYEESNLIRQAFILVDSFEKFRIVDERDKFINECRKYIDRLNQCYSFLWIEYGNIVDKAFDNLEEKIKFRKMLNNFIKGFTDSFQMGIGYSGDLNQYSISIKKGLLDVIEECNTSKYIKAFKMLNTLEEEGDDSDS